MSSEHADNIRTALASGFSIVTLREVERLSLSRLQQQPPHSAIFLCLATMARWVADAWDGIQLSTAVANRVEAQLRPGMLELLDVEEADPAVVCDALDQVAISFAKAIRDGLDSIMS